MHPPTGRSNRTRSQTSTPELRRIAQVDLAALENGLTVIPDFAPMRRTHAQSPDERFLRRGCSYDDTTGSSGGSGGSDAGLLFAAYMADIDRQFLPVQRRLAEFDLLNRWTTPVGSAVFALLPGCREGGWLGAAVLGGRGAAVSAAR